MTVGTLEIHSENILPIIKKWLYSDRDIFVRELISNACDAIQKVKRLRDQNEVEAQDADFRIDLAIDKEKKTLTFIDNGIGMDSEEVVKYIAQIAFSGAEEFAKHYQSDLKSEQFIGHFGLGFYSSYMVAGRVLIDTLSYKDGAKAVQWDCDGSHSYTLSEGARTERGTSITLYLQEDSLEFLEESRLKALIRRYCYFLPYPIYMDGQRVNGDSPLWMKGAQECTDQEYLDFFKELYPSEEEPHFWIHLNVDYPFDLKGILYFPKMRRDFDFSKSHVQLYCNRVFVSDDCKDIIPNYLNILKGAIDCPDIPLNVSRSQLQMDKTVRQLAAHISKKVADQLQQLFKSDRERYHKVWSAVEPIVKLGALEDDKFYARVKEIILWKNDQDEWVTTDEALAKSSNKTLYYAEEGKVSDSILAAYQKQNLSVLFAKMPLDTAFISLLENKMEGTSFCRIDGAIESLVDEEREKVVLDSEGKTEGRRIADFIKQCLDEEMLEVEAKSLKDDQLPAILVVKEEERRMRDYFKRMSEMHGEASIPSLPLKKTLVVNTNNEVIDALVQLKDKEFALAQEMARHLYQMTLLGQHELDRKEQTKLTQSAYVLMGKLAKKLIFD
ncbi:MAG: htpG [Chlamydiales bacterium]|jgi:molecular chaperone HtpG|nr:htpG [Chlamydiales bacterium]